MQMSPRRPSPRIEYPQVQALNHDVFPHLQRLQYFLLLLGKLLSPRRRLVKSCFGTRPRQALILYRLRVKT
nr:hypothetical protein [Bacillus cereus]